MIDSRSTQGRPGDVSMVFRSRLTGFSPGVQGPSERIALRSRFVSEARNQTIGDRLPTVQFAGQSVECLLGANLRAILLRVRLPLYTRVARAIHCRGNGTCGTCAVEIEGPVSKPTSAELRRLRLPPHHAGTGLRLACQCEVLGDIKVTKHEGFFGQRANRPTDRIEGDTAHED